MRKYNFSKGPISFFVVLAVILLLIFFNFKGWLGLPKDIVYWGFQPFLKSFKWIGEQADGGLKAFLTIKDLALENSKLKEENAKLWQENSAGKEAARENELLRQRLDLGPIKNYKLVIVKIVGYNTENNQYFLIDKGQADGVAENSIAITANNFLVGKVVEVGRNWARVLLACDPSSMVNVLTQETRISGIIKGAHGLGMTMQMIPIDKEIKPGETILTLGRDDIFPDGLIVGKIGEVIQKESDIFQQATVLPAADFRSLEDIFVLIK